MTDTLRARRVPEYSDLKLIDELLIDMKPHNERWADFENFTSVTRRALARLRAAWL